MAPCALESCIPSAWNRSTQKRRFCVLNDFNLEVGAEKVQAEEVGLRGQGERTEGEKSGRSVLVRDSGVLASILEYSGEIHPSSQPCMVNDAVWCFWVSNDWNTQVPLQDAVALP